MQEKTTAISLPSEVCASAMARYGSRFANIEELLVFLLQELMRDDAVQMDEKEQKVLEARLKDLGYL
jgi:hypothetical protein